MVRQNDGWRELRGVAFPHTTARELFWTTELASLRAEGVMSANEAVGWFSYDSPHAPFGAQAPPSPLLLQHRSTPRGGAGYLTLPS